MPELDFQSALDTNWIVLGSLSMEAVGDRVIVIQDDFKFGTECTVCGAKDIRMISQTEQRSVVTCEDCAGSRVFNGKKCATCDGLGWHICRACNGSGTEGGAIAHPKDRERRPTTGIIVSKGWRVEHYNRGESVIYPSHAGHAFDLEAVDTQGNDIQVSIVILREDEIITRVKGHLELRRMKKSSALHTAA